MEKKVLIVDDDERVVQSIAGVLEDEGFQVITAKSGEEAIEIFEQKRPDVTLLDIWMPGMDGIEVLKRLKRMVPDCQAIMISGHATISTAMTAVKLGAFDFIEKPISLDKLLITLSRAIEREILRSENVELKERVERKFRMVFTSSSEVYGDWAEVMTEDVLRRTFGHHLVVLHHGEHGGPADYHVQHGAHAHEQEGGGWTG